MTLSMVVILSLAVLFWIVSSRLEWSIPLNWQADIRKWQKGLCDKSYCLNFVWEMGPETGEMEKRFWLLRRALPSLQKNKKLPLWIEVEIYPNLSPGQREKYIACLQRRFSEMKIYVYPPSGEGGSEEN